MHSTLKRFIVLVLHRRAGKTTAAINHLNRDALRYANTKYAYIAPTYKQAKRIVWIMLKGYVKGVRGIRFNESELTVFYPNGSVLIVAGADNPDSLRGIGLHGAFLDEYPLQNPIIFTEILSKCVADTMGYIIFGGTPKGKDHFYRTMLVAEQDPDNWLLIRKTIDESLKEEDGQVIDNLRNALEDDKRLVLQGLMSEDRFQQEWYNSFEASVPGAVYLKEISLAREQGRLGLVSHYAGQPVYTVWDLGVGDANAIGFFQVIAGRPVMIDYYENTGLGLPAYIKIVKDKPYIYAKHFAPHDIKQREYTTGQTRLETAKTLGIEFEVVPGVSLDDGIDKTRIFWSRLIVNTRLCQTFLDLIGMYHYIVDETTGMRSRIPHHDFTSHAADMLRYASLVEDQMRMDEVFDDVEETDTSFYEPYMGTEDPWNEDKGHPMLKGIDIGKL